VARPGSQRRARRLLKLIYAVFTEGFETTDLRAATALIGEVSQPSQRPG